MIPQGIFLRIVCFKSCKEDEIATRKQVTPLRACHGVKMPSALLFEDPPPSLSNCETSQLPLNGRHEDNVLLSTGAPKPIFEQLPPSAETPKVQRTR